jgi:putative endonuclease
MVKRLNKDVGNYCEDLAKEYLKDNNYRILDCNFRNFLGEIDIICTQNNLLIIVEVKGRYNYSYGLPRESVSFSKQNAIARVTKSYLAYKRLYNLNVRFDVIEVYLNSKNSVYIIEHIKDAFRLY